MHERNRTDAGRSATIACVNRDATAPCSEVVSIRTEDANEMSMIISEQL